MKFFVRWAFRLFVVLVVLVVALVLLKDVLLKAYTKHHIRSQTGMDVKIARFETGLFSPTLTIEGCQLYNPAQFGGSPFLNIPDLYVECDPGALAQRRLRFRLLRLTVAEINIVEDRSGQTNFVAAVKNLQRAARAPRLASVPGLEFAGVDVLNLTLGRLTYTSLRHPGKPLQPGLYWTRLVTPAGRQTRRLVWMR